MVITAKKEKKIPVEKLQEEHLQGPMDKETVEETREQLQENQIVPVAAISNNYEKITFRNQRDPGHTLEFFYISATHPYKSYKLKDQGVYTLPMEVIRNLETRRENIYKHRKNQEGEIEQYVAGYKSYFVCERT